MTMSAWTSERNHQLLNDPRVELFTLELADVPYGFVNG
jgi:hypothetical protein